MSEMKPIEAFQRTSWDRILSQRTLKGPMHRRTASDGLWGAAARGFCVTDKRFVRGGQGAHVGNEADRSIPVHVLSKRSFKGTMHRRTASAGLWGAAARGFCVTDKRFVRGGQGAHVGKEADRSIPAHVLGPNPFSEDLKRPHALSDGFGRALCRCCQGFCVTDNRFVRGGLGAHVGREADRSVPAHVRGPDPKGVSEMCIGFCTWLYTTYVGAEKMSP
jgi:hypothetical protein